MSCFVIVVQPSIVDVFHENSRNLLRCQARGHSAPTALGPSNVSGTGADRLE